MALSTAEAEYVALCMTAQEAAWLQQLMTDLLNKRVQTTKILEDNQFTICLTKNTQVHGRTKRIDHFIRDLVDAKRIELSYCPMESMTDDMLTKGLSIKRFVKLCKLNGQHDSLRD